MTAMGDGLPEQEAIDAEACILSDLRGERGA
jgi:hypothetical protein